MRRLGHSIRRDMCGKLKLMSAQLRNSCQWRSAPGVCECVSVSVPKPNVLNTFGHISSSVGRVPTRVMMMIIDINGRRRKRERERELRCYFGYCYLAHAIKEFQHISHIRVLACVCVCVCVCIIHCYDVLRLA